MALFYFFLLVKHIKNVAQFCFEKWAETGYNPLFIVFIDNIIHAFASQIMQNLT